MFESHSLQRWVDSNQLADLRVVLELDNAGVYENLLRDPSLHDHVAKSYAAIDFRTSTQVFAREVTPELVKALTP